MNENLRINKGFLRMQRGVSQKIKVRPSHCDEKNALFTRKKLSISD